MPASLLGIFTGADGSSPITTSSRTTTSGSLITGCGAGWHDATGQTITISSNQAGVYTEEQEFEFTSGAGSFVNMAVAQNIGGTRGAGHTITNTLGSGGTVCSVTAQEWDGIESSPTVAKATNTGASTDPTVSVAVGASSLAVGMACYDGTTVLTFDTDSPGTEASAQDIDNTNQAQVVSYKVGQTGSPSIDWTLNASRTWGAIIVTFTESAGPRRWFFGAGR